MNKRTINDTYASTVSEAITVKDGEFIIIDKPKQWKTREQVENEISKLQRTNMMKQNQNERLRRQNLNQNSVRHGSGEVEYHFV